MPRAPAYDVSEVSDPLPDSIGICLMSLSSTAHNLVVLASEGAEQHGGNHDSLNPYLTGGAAFVILMLMLWVTTRLNRDR